MSKDIKTLTKKIVSTTLDDSLAAAMSIQDLLAENIKNKEEIIPLLIESLKSEKDTKKLRRIIWACSVFEIAGAKEFLEQLLTHEDPGVREEVILALGILKDRNMIEPLKKILNEPSNILREEAAIALGLMEVEEAVEPLIKQLDDPDIDIIISSTLALSKLKNPKALKPLINKLNHKNKNVRKYARKTIFSFGKTAIEPLKDALKEVSIFKKRRITKLIDEINNYASS